MSCLWHELDKATSIFNDVSEIIVNVQTHRDIELKMEASLN